MKRYAEKKKIIPENFFFFFLSQRISKAKAICLNFSPHTTGQLHFQDAALILMSHEEWESTHKEASILPTFSPGLMLLLLKDWSKVIGTTRTDDRWPWKGPDLGLKVKQGALMVSPNPEALQKVLQGGGRKARHMSESPNSRPKPNLSLYNSQLQTDSQGLQNTGEWNPWIVDKAVLVNTVYWHSFYG